MESIPETDNSIKNIDLQQLNQLTHQQQFRQLSLSEDNEENKKLQFQISYRADIDGLRTVAVGIVVIFHAWPLFMPGGFIGVDVFFVISGYLISGIIIKQALKNKFSYTDFYSRRIKRIYPALIAVLIFVLTVSVKKLAQRSVQIMSKTMVASTLFAANIQILTAENDYFDPETQSNPLLHLWSLGVEEQFYIFWPLLLTVIFSKFPKRAFLILSTYTVLSFIISIVCVFNDTQFAFYFPFCRFWQMSVGGLIAYMNSTVKNKILSNVLSIVSIIAIMTAVWIIDEDSMFPGFWALIPTLGAACIIQAGNESLVNKYILSSKPFVFIGKISYSLYLWHWPLLVFSRILYPQGSDSMLARPQVIVVISLIISLLTYHFVENPFRFRKQIIVPIILLIIMIGVSLSAYQMTSFSNQRSQLQQIQLQEKIVIENDQIDSAATTQNTIDPWIPLQEDFIINKKGRKIPNSSKNPHREPPTTEKIEQSKKQRKYSAQQRHSQVLLEKKVTKKSRYFNQKANDLFHHYEVTNEGRQKVIFIIGDSHARFILSRFHKLYEDSVKQNRKQNFPTILSMVRDAYLFDPKRTEYNITMQIIEKFKPDRILFVFRWIRCEKVTYHMRPMPSKWTQDFKNTMRIVESQLIKLKKTGIEIYISGISPCGEQYNPWIMADENGIIQNNIKPFNLTMFRERYIEYFNIFDSVVNITGIQMVDFTDYMCYKDVCEVLTPNGYPITLDRNHQTKLYVRNWAHSVDFLTEF